MNENHKKFISDISACLPADTDLQLGEPQDGFVKLMLHGVPVVISAGELDVWPDTSPHFVNIPEDRKVDTTVYGVFGCVIAGYLQYSLQQIHGQDNLARLWIRSLRSLIFSGG